MKSRWENSGWCMVQNRWERLFSSPSLLNDERQVAGGGTVRWNGLSHSCFRSMWLGTSATKLQLGHGVVVTVATIRNGMSGNIHGHGGVGPKYVHRTIALLVARPADRQHYTNGENFSVPNLTLKPYMLTQLNYEKQQIQGIRHRYLHSNHKPKRNNMPAFSPKVKQALLLSACTHTHAHIPNTSVM